MAAPGGVVGRTEVDHIGMEVGGYGAEAVRFVQRDKADRAARHDVGIEIDGIYRVGDENHIVPVENIANIPHVALRAVGNKYLVRPDLHAARRIVAGSDGLAQERVARVGPVAVEALGAAISSTALCIASTTAGASGRVTSPMPRLIKSLSGFASLKAETRCLMVANR